MLFTDFPEDLLKKWKERLFDRVVEGLRSRKIGAHNHDVWIVSAMGLKGLLFNEEVETHLRKLEEIAERSFLKNGFWYEGSIHYHFYALEGFVKFYLPYLVKTGRRSEVLDENLRKAFRAPISMIFPDGRFPNPGDGWPRIGLNSYSDVLEYGAQLFDDDLIKKGLCLARSGKLRGEDLPIYGREVSKGVYPELFYFDNECLENPSVDLPKEVFGPGESVLFRAGRWTVFLKSGQSSSSHVHEDICSLEAYFGKVPIFADLSNTGYGIPESRKWFSKGLSHNTFFLNGRAERFIGPMRIQRDGRDFGCTMNRNPFGYEFSRWIEVRGDSLVVNSIFKKDGERLGMSFVLPHEIELSGEVEAPNVEASEYIRWVRKLDGKLSMDFESFKLEIKANGEIYLGRSFWIPRGRGVTVVYLEGNDHLESRLVVTGR